MLERLKEILSGDPPSPASIAARERELQLELAKSLDGLVPVYLDTRFWVEIRKAEQGSQSPAVELLQALREAVESKRIFCPISASSFMELLQHADFTVRENTARLVDELSLGVSFVAPDVLIASEVEWLMGETKDCRLDPSVVPLWTKLGHALGSPELSPEAVPAALRSHLQLATSELLWEMPFQEIAGTVFRERPEMGSAAERISSDTQAYANEITDFRSAYRAEAWGIAQISAPFVAQYVRANFPEAPQSADPSELEGWAKLIAAALVEAKGRQALRSMHARACWHAAYRINRGRKFRPNDFLDIEHAACGVGYCGAFLSENSLVTAMTQSPVRLNDLYGCFVTQSVDAATRYVGSV